MTVDIRLFRSVSSYALSKGHIDVFCEEVHIEKKVTGCIDLPSVPGAGAVASTARGSTPGTFGL